MMKNDLLLPRRFKITKIKNENQHIKTFYLESFDKKIINPNPGNYVMIWLPFAVDKNIKLYSDEKPMSISDIDGNNNIAITVKKVGTFTRELHKYKEGMQLGITGPLGNHFIIKGKKLLFIGGGTGIAPLRFLSKITKQKNLKKYAIIGAKTKNELLLIDDLKKHCNDVVITTDDGTIGKKGFATNYLSELNNSFSFDQIFCCGPEVMMKKVLDFALKNKIDAQFSLERYMYCAKGLCGFCSIDGLRVCKDGPVFDSNTLSKVKDFGKKIRTKEGIVVDLK